MKRKILILICLIVFIFSIVSVSASDDFNQTEDNVIGDEDALSVSQSDIEISESADNGTFTDLQKKIDGASEGTTINLEKNYKYDSSVDLGEITINKRLTINGNGYTFDGNNEIKIFSIDSRNVVLNNISFINGKSDYYGGAIYAGRWSGGNVVIGNCCFVNCSASAGGGAISGVGSVSNCCFVNCSADGSGGYAGAISGVGSVSNCCFVNCSAWVGGAIIGDDSVVNCCFVNCSARNSGGAVEDVDYVANCSFVNCSAGGFGGAIDFDGYRNLVVVDCGFANCVAGIYGGAIYSYENLDVVNCSFVNNSAKYGFIYARSGIYTIVNTIFINNTPKFDVNITVDKNVFYSFENFNVNIQVNPNPFIVNLTSYITVNFNGKEERINLINGVANYSLGDLRVGDYTLYITYEDNIYKGNASILIKVIKNTDYCSFKDLQDIIDNAKDGDTIELSNNFIHGLNTEDKTIEINKTLTINGNGHTINGNGNWIANIGSNNIVLNNIRFINGKSDKGGAIYSLYDNLTVGNCSFVDCSAGRYGGAIYSYGNLDVGNCSFVNCSSYYCGGAIYVGIYENYKYSDGKCNLVNCSFVDCSASHDSGAIYSYWDLDVGNCSFVNCSVRDGGGGAIRIGIHEGSDYSGGKCNLVNCSFVYCSAGGFGGAAIYARLLTVVDSSFVNCSSSGGGGVIYVPFDEESSGLEKEFNLINCSFVNCTGGAVKGVTFAVDCSFVNCSALDIYESGGAIFTGFDSVNVVVGNCSFVNCSSSEGGGAIYVYGDHSSFYVVGCSFVNCFTIDESTYLLGGGAIHGHGWFSNISVGNCSFVNCHASEGGAVSGVDIVGNCSFVNCSSSDDGGAVYEVGSVVDCSFVNCSSSDDGGAVSGVAIVGNCSFVNCSSNGGAAVYEVGSVVDCSFVNCSAQYGGAVSGVGSVVDCSFVNCSAQYGGALIGVAIVGNCSFVNCSSSDDGGAVYDVGAVSGVAIVGNCSFVNCSAGGSGGAVSGVAIVGNCSFVYCSSSNGGAISASDWGDVGVVVGNCSFVYCSAQYGGAIYGVDSVVDCSFVNCSVGAGSAILADFKSINVVVGNCTFIGCSAQYGGVIRVEKVNMDIFNCTFIKNNASDGGVIYFDKELSHDMNHILLIKCTDLKFNNNVPNVYGGGISFSNNILFIEGFAWGEGLGISGDVYVNIAGKSLKYTFDYGKAIFDLSEIPAGTWDTIISYSGDYNYAPFEITIPLTIGDSSINLDVSDVTKDYRGPECLEITLTESGKPVENADVNININSIDYTKTTDKNGKASLDLDLNAGTYNAVVSYHGVSATAKITVNQLNTETTLSSTKNSPSTVTLTAVINSTTATGDVIFTVNNENYTAEISGGKATYKLSGLEVGSYDAKAVYKGEMNYGASSSNTITFTVEDAEYDVNAPDLTKYYHGPERFIVTVKDKANNPVSGKNVTINLNGATYTRTTNENGEALMAINLNSGVYMVTSEFEGIGVESTITVKSTVSGENITKIFRNGTQYYATFVDTSGKTLAENTAVEFNINGVFYTRYTNEKGVARMNINLNPGEYIITAKNPNSGEMYTNIVTVLPSIVENYDLTKYYKNASRYSLRVLDDKGNPVKAGVDVKLNINGVFYTRTSDDDGYVKMNINLEPGEYTITAEYNGLMASNKITVLSVIETHDLSMKYRDGSKFEAKILDGQGRPYAGQTVTFNINGVFYEKATDENGIARLTINLMAGEYIITSSYNGMNAANKVTVSS